MRIVLETLFEKINTGSHHPAPDAGSGYESNYDSFKQVYSDLDKLKKNLEQETYFENIDNAIVETMETARNLDDIEFEVTFDIKLPQQERDKQTVYAYLSEI